MGFALSRGWGGRDGARLLAMHLAAIPARLTFRGVGSIGETPALRGLPWEGAAPRAWIAALTVACLSPQQPFLYIRKELPAKPQNA